MSDHYFDTRKGSLVEFYLKETIVGISEQIGKENVHISLRSFFKKNYIFEKDKLCLKK